MNRRRLRKIALNSFLGLALVLVGVLTYVSVGSASNTKTLPGHPVTISRGTLAATVTASGNVESARTVNLQLSGTSGTITAVYVKVGQTVRRGQPLLKVDQASARSSLSTARASLATAKGQLKTATQGRSKADRRVDRAGIAAAKTTLSNARAAVAAAKSTYAQDRRQQAKLVKDAKRAVSDAKGQRSSDKKQLKDAQRQLSSDQAKGNAAAVSTDQSNVASLTSTVRSDDSAVTSAASARTQAEQTRDRTLLADRQAIRTQQGQADAADAALRSQRATAAAAAQPARRGAVDSAKAGVASAQATVTQAERTLDDTVLRAPEAATVAAVSAVAGQSSTAAAAGSSTTTSTTTSSGASAGSASSASSGLVTLADLGHLRVKAAVAEADATKVRVGQLATVTFSASGRTAPGRVSAIDPQSTVTNNVVEYDVTVALPPGAAGIRLGQTANVVITTARRAGVLVVPTSAITISGNSSVVIRRSGGVDSPVVVRTGIVGSTGTEITAGLSPGDVVVLPTGEAGSAFTFPGAPTSSATPK